MALGSLPPAAESWGRWPQPQHGGADFNMIPTSMMPYDCRTTTTTAPLQRTELAHHFLPVTFSQAPVTSAAPQFPSPISYSGYNAYTAPPMMDAPFKPDESLDRAAPVARLPVNEEAQERATGLPPLRGDRSPSIKSEAKLARPGSPSPKPEVPSTPPLGPARVHQFNTAIDNLVRAIEANAEIFDLTDGAKPTGTGESGGRTPQTQLSGKTRRKRFSCDFPGCSKMFAQKNNLDTHRRCHTGETPYVCPYCNRRFTQSVNLKSHINRHTGARPYKCPQCPKRFPQPSNVKAHMKTHVRRELRAHWICRFAGCEKAFTAKGNLKNHQNTYHVEAIEAFNAKLAAMEDKSMLSQEEKEMAKYLAEVHNLANKGIKGRGKGRKVKRVLMLQPPQHQQPSPSPATSPVSTVSSVDTSPYPVSLVHHGLPVVQHQHQHQHQHQAAPLQPQTAHHPHGGLPFYGLSHPATYSISRPPNMVFGGSSLGVHGRDAYGPHGGYGMLDSDQLSDASSVHASTPVVHVYEEDHGRVMAYGDRLY